MGLFDFLRSEKRDNGNTFLKVNSPLFGANAGVAVDKNSALSFSAVLACVRVISESIGSLPIHTYRVEEDGDRKIDKAHPVSKLIQRPNQYQTTYNFFSVAMTNLLLEGNCYFLIERDGSARPTALIYLNPDKVDVIPFEGNLFYQHADFEQPIPQTDILHFMGTGFDGKKGKSVLKMQQDTIGLSLGANITAATYFGQSAQVAGVLKTDHKLTDEQIQRLRNSWNSRHQGPYNSNKTAILEQGMDFKPISISANDKQLLQSRQFQVEEIARIFRTPLSLIGHLEKSANHNSIEQLSTDFVRFTLTPYLVQLEQEMNIKLFRDNEFGEYEVKFDTKGLLRGDSNARATYYREMMQIGALSINEVRQAEQLNRIGDEGDVHYFPLNFAPIGTTEESND
jgi:HK97 family phage portal protein